MSKQTTPIIGSIVNEKPFDAQKLAEAELNWIALDKLNRIKQRTIAEMFDDDDE
jgi:hypothetical protein